MPNQTREQATLSDYLFNSVPRKILSALATIVSGKNPDGSDFTFFASLRAPSGEFIDRSGTISNAAQSQDLMDEFPSRGYLLIQNVSDGLLAFNTNGAASFGPGSIVLEPGGSYEPAFIPTGAITIIGGTAGQAFTAKEA